jgi:hypothetical protein
MSSTWIFLGFEVQWEHRFEDNAPLYTEIARDGCVLHLSEHHGDASPGSAVRVRVGDIAALHRELIAKNYRFHRFVRQPAAFLRGDAGLQASAAAGRRSVKSRDF